MNMKLSSFLIHRNINRRENKAQILLKSYSNPPKNVLSLFTCIEADAEEPTLLAFDG